MLKVVPCLSWILAALVQPIQGLANSTPEQVIEEFYRAYFASLGRQVVVEPNFPYSQDFKASIDANRASCQEFSDGVCGFGTDGDVFLDSQEIEEGISFASARVCLVEVSPGFVLVSFNVYPSLVAHREHYQKHVTYKMIYEDGNWVVDDIAYSDGVSSKLRMSRENEYYRRNPDPGSRFEKRRRGDGS